MAEVIGAISAVIALIETSIKMYDSAQKDIKLSDTFEVVRRRLPVILHTLATCKGNLESRKDTIPEDVCEALEQILEACESKASNLRGIFEKVIPGESDSREKRYLKVLRKLGKGNKVEELMLGLTEDVQLIVNHDAVKSAGQQQNTELEDIINEMKSVMSVPDEESSTMSFSSGGGAQTNNINRASGQQINNNGPVGTQHFVTYRQKDDFSFHKPAGVCLGQAPYIPPGLFVGRDSELDEIAEILHPIHEPQKQQRIVLGGMGGVGKTQLAIAYAESPRGSYSSVFWLNAASESSLKDSFRSIARIVFDVRESGVLEGKETVRRVHQWLSDPSNTRWLLIFDNYDDPDQFKIVHYYPPASHGASMITTRRPDLVAGRTLHIKPFQNIEHSLAVLQTRSKRENIQSDAYAEQLAERLAGLPLALASAGAYLQRSTFTFERYLQEYEKRWNIDPRRPLQLQEYEERTLYTTWDLSYARLERNDPDAAKLLKLLAYFNNQSLWHKLFLAGLTDSSPKWLHEVISDDVNFDGVMRTLTEYYFLEVQQTVETWSMHNCVHDWTLAALNKDINTQHYWYAVDCVDAYLSADDDGLYAHRSYSRLAAHAAQLAQQHFVRENLISCSTPRRLNKVSSISVLLQGQMQLSAAGRMIVQVLAGKEKALGPDHTSTLNTVTKLGKLYQMQGKLDQAEQMCQRALSGKEKALEVDHPSTLDTVRVLASIYHEQGKLDQAEQMYQRVLAGHKKVVEVDYPYSLITVTNLGNLYQTQGKLDEAEQMY